MAGQVFNRVIEFFTPDPYPPICKMPGCKKQGYVENNGYAHEFCGKTHAREYHAMKDAEKQQKTREKRLKAVQSQSSGGQGSWPSYSMAAAQHGAGHGPSCTRSACSGAAYGMCYLECSME